MNPGNPAASLRGRPVTVMGLGLFGGGAGVSKYLARQGARVTVTDLRSERELEPALRELAGLPLRLVLGEHRESDFTDTDMVIANPAVSPRNPYLELARKAGVHVTSETALFLAACRARIAAVTGTQGKSSTCNTLAQLLAAAGFRVHLGGNIGRSLLEALDELGADDVVVLELSSYQLEALPQPYACSPGSGRVEIVAVTNVLADHLERHGSVDAYAAAKQRILELAAAVGGTAVLSAEDERLARWCAHGVTRLDLHVSRASDRGLNLAAGQFRSGELALGRTADLRLAGAYQVENTLIALGMAHALGADPRALRAGVARVRGLPHRQEDLGVFAGHRVWDNGVSTTPDSTLSVLQSMQPGCTLMCGGKAKELTLALLVEVARARVRRVVCFGAARELLGAAFRAAGIETWTAATLEEAVDVAFARMDPGEELLFSPACASFDAYLNFKERALAFRRALPVSSAPAAQAPTRART